LSVGLIFLFHIKNIVTHKKKVILIILLSIFSGLAIINSKAINTSYTDLTSYKGLSSLRERVGIWNKTTQIIIDNPILGIGSGNWKYNYSKYSIKDIDKILFYNKSFQRPHNDFLWILSETGIVGFALITLILFFLIKHSFLKIRASENKKSLILFSFLTGLLIISFFSFPKERITHILLVAVILGLLIKDLNIKPTYLESKKIITPLLLLTFLLFNIIMGTYRLKGEYYTNLLLKEKSKKKPRNVISYGVKANSFFYKSDPTSTPIASYIGWGYNTLNNIDSLHFYAKKAYDLSPYDYEVLTNYGYVLERKRQSNTAKEILLESYKINPRFESTAINLTVLEYNNRNYKEALNWITSIHDYEKKYAPYLIKIKEKLAQQK
jgi:tetratricopeptide (TPR) repeat protein